MATSTIPPRFTRTYRKHFPRWPKWKATGHAGQLSQGSTQSKPNTTTLYQAISGPWEAAAASKAWRVVEAISQTSLPATVEHHHTSQLPMILCSPLYRLSCVPHWGGTSLIGSPTCQDAGRTGVLTSGHALLCTISYLHFTTAGTQRERFSTFTISLIRNQSATARGQHGRRRSFDGNEEDST